MTSTEWEIALKQARMQKDEFFASHPGSPIPPGDRSEFSGLDYFPPDSGYRFEIELLEHEEKETIRMEYTQGGEQEFIRWGEFRFEVNGAEQTIQAYKSDPNEDKLFILFRDATSGKETYGAGRYLDLDAEADRTSDGKWILDFNKAYNPWCVYSERFTCPFVPPENWLDVAIKAGEKTYPVKGEES